MVQGQKGGQPQFSTKPRFSIQIKANMQYNESRTGEFRQSVATRTIVWMLQGPEIGKNR
jgi:hypothetical protein